jgi:sporulation protein YlmC with PRC-barrel domain
MPPFPLPRIVTMADELGDRKRSRDLIGKTIVSKTGRKFGRVGDIRFEPRTGELIDVIVANPSDYSKSVIVSGKEGIIKIPFSAVISIGDFVIVSEEDIV